jgi:hypothetical protein
MQDTNFVVDSRILVSAAHCAPVAGSGGAREACEPGASASHIAASLWGSYVRPHYHVNGTPAASCTRHQILVCQRGSMGVGLYTKKGERIAHIILRAGDLCCCAKAIPRERRGR